MGRTATLAYNSLFISTTAHSWHKRLSVVAKVNICIVVVEARSVVLMLCTFTLPTGGQEFHNLHTLDLTYV